jgi:membrane-associated protein
MESIIAFITEHAVYAHYYIFFILMLAGLNFPISEDLTIITAGMLASTIVPENTAVIFFWLFLGCYLSDWEAYWIGRKLGPKLWTSPRFFGAIRPGQLETIERFWNRFGGFTLLFGRFIPFGVRNCLFMTAGMGKMPFHRFLIIDGISCAISTTTLFSLAYSFGKNYHDLYLLLQRWNVVIFWIFSLCVAGIAAGVYWKKRNRLLEPERNNQ